MPLTAGCLANYGTMEPSRDINKLFESYQVMPDYRYYYTGGQNNPKVIMGIRKDYTLKTSSWIPMDPLTSDILKKRIDAMTNLGTAGWAVDGWMIYSPAGEKVGLWYSRLGHTTVKFGENKEVLVSQPRSDDPEDRGPFHLKRAGGI